MTTINATRELLERAVQAIINTSQMHPTLEDLRALLHAPVPAEDREAFEQSYAREFSGVCGYPVSGAEIALMREGDRYGERHYLNGQWAGWKARGNPPPQKYDDTLLPFLALMRGELHANSQKGDREAWLRMTPEQALDEIRHHADKLIGPVMGRDGDRIREHAADVANCAMMLADIAGVLSRE